ncbi:hypothetical protein [Sediminispirochaeta bajacaliforniensis]|uniref:hypothetical protein n=1 Tax=Sediminispirochaeta bajacaliforniensis TaxID=148 RepID=UPI0003776EE6|nr:hypothetical protein [Sediminispirochaeta bajacaliforniensis]
MKKLPKRFRKALSQKQLQKKILSRIHLPKEKELVRSLYKQGDDGRFRMEMPQDPGTAKHLKKIAKAIGKNKGMVTTWKLAILLIPIAAVLVFSLFFVDRLTQHGIEQSLEGIFGAQVDAEEVDLSLFSGRISLASLTVADEEKPMKNLFELGPTVIDIDLSQLLKRRFIIERAESRSILFGTDRQVSGVLETTTEGNGSQKDVVKKEEESQLEKNGQELITRSAQSLLDRYQSSLTSPELLTQGKEELEELSASWETRVESYDDQLRDLRHGTESLLKRDIGDLKSPEAIASYVKELSDLKTSVQQIGDDFESGLQAVREDADRASAYRREIETSVERDRAFLREAVDSFSSDAVSAIGSNAERILTDRFGALVPTAKKVIGYIGKLSEEKKTKEESSDRKEHSRQGEVIRFIDDWRPAFLLQSFLVEFGESGDTGYTRVSLSDISSNPKGWKRPITLSVGMVTDSGDIETDMEASVTDKGTSVDTKLNLKRIPVKTGPMSELGIAGISAQAALALQTVMDQHLTGTGGGDIRLEEINYDFSPSQDLLSRAAKAVLAENNSIALTTDFSLDNGIISSITAETDLDEKIGKALMQFGKQEAMAQSERLLADFNASITEELAQVKGAEVALHALSQALASDKSESDQIEREIERQKAEAEQRAKRIIEQKADEGKKALESLGKSFGF